MNPWIGRLPAAAVLGTLAGCVVSLANSPIVTSRLQLISAGYTGCKPDDNAIANVVTHIDGTGLWNATCKGKVYLCSATSTTNSESYSCAPAVD